MSYRRKIEWLNNKHIYYRQDPINDKPTFSTDTYDYYENGTHEYYNLFNTQSKITTYKSLKWHMLVLHYLNHERFAFDSIINLYKFIANKENGFVTFFIKSRILDDMIQDVINQGGDAPKNRARKIIFKDYNGLSFNEKMKVVGQLSGRQKLDKESIYQTMLDLNEFGKPITNSRLASLLDCSVRTIQRHMCAELKREKEILNEEV
tara:strand:- start:659 stop:1276 length:618 start_codon:yes stop_codon:yes gene_type:complete